MTESEPDSGSHLRAAHPTLRAAHDTGGCCTEHGGSLCEHACQITAYPVRPLELPTLAAEALALGTPDDAGSPFVVPLEHIPLA